MKRHILTFISFFFIFQACNVDNRTNTDNSKIDTTTKEFNSDTTIIENKIQPKNIRFDFSTKFTKEISGFKNLVEVKGLFYNDNLDTVYFLSSTCNGIQYSIKYDTAKFDLLETNCNANYPVIIKIDPKGHHDFRILFIAKTKVKSMKLGYNLYWVDKSLDLKKITLQTIYGRPLNTDNIVWSDEVEIK